MCMSALPVAMILAFSPAWSTNGTHLPYAEFTFGPWNDASPAWSPDGTMIAYASDRGGSWAIYVTSADGLSDRRVSPSGANATDPSWSPDSRGVAFLSSRGGRTDIQIASLTNSTVLTITEGRYSIAQRQPLWSPDGTRIAFLARSATTALISIDVVSRAATLVASISGTTPAMTWVSSTRLAYSTRANMTEEIDWVDVSTGKGGVIHSGNANYSSPVFSPRAARLAYITDLTPPIPDGRLYPCYYRPGDYNLWMSNSDGWNVSFQAGPTGSSNSWVAPPHPAPYTPGSIPPEQELAWSPDGRTVAYISENSAFGSCVYLWDTIMSMSTISPLGPINASATHPSWSSDSSILVFAASAQGYSHLFILNATGQVQPMPTGQIEGVFA
jgi:dipeptidyl aminopeptidase/acylaminoacyl peptidase